MAALWADASAYHLREANAAYQSGDLATAIRLYRAFLKDYPDAAEIRSNLGAALARDGQFAAAIAEYNLALRKVPNNAQVRMNLALAYYKLGRLPEALPHLDLLHKRQPLELKPALLLGDCLLETNQAHKAVEVLTPLAEEYPDDRAVIYTLGMALLKDNRTQEAQALLDRILRNGQSAESEFLLGQGELLRNDLVAAAGHLKRAVELNPKMPWAHSLWGQALKAAGKPELATEQFREELKVNPYDFTANTEIAMLLSRMANWTMRWRMSRWRCRCAPTIPAGCICGRRCTCRRASTSRRARNSSTCCGTIRISPRLTPRSLRSITG